MHKPRGLFILNEDAHRLVYAPTERSRIASLVDLVAPLQTRHTIEAQPDLLKDIDVIFSGWGAPVMDEDFLQLAPKLAAVFYGGGAVGSWMTEAVWQRGIVVTSAHVANSQPVAEYALATIIFSLKHGWALNRQTRAERRFPPRDGAPGCFGSTVGIVSLGVTARALLKLLRPLDVRVIAYDPFVNPAEAEALDVEMVSLDELFVRSDVVSVHTPLLDETIGLVRGDHLASMKPGATLINTARGAIVEEAEMLAVLSRRPDLQAVLDVSDPEPPASDSPLFSLPNVVLTPHIAGSVGPECRRMGQAMVAELERYLRGEPLQWAITPELAAVSSHRPATAKLSLTLNLPRKLRGAGANPASVSQA